MKSILRKSAVIFFTAVLLSAMYVSTAFAATSKIVIHAKDGQSWGSMNVYNWGDKGETAGVWPGTAMTEEGDGWYTYTIETEVPLNLVFSAAGGSPQSSNVNDVAVDSGEIWVVIGGEGEANDMGASTNEAVLYTAAEDGWPTAVAATETTTEETAAATEDTAASTDAPGTGETGVPAAVLFSLAALSASAMLIVRKKGSTVNN